MSLSITNPHSRCLPCAANPRHVAAVGYAVIVLAVVAVEVVGGRVTAGEITDWYAALAKPVWTPPDWVFAPVWTALYAAMAVAACLVWAARDRADVCGPLGLFGVQLAANLSWTVFFFGLHSLLFGLVTLAVLGVVVVLTIVEFARVSRLAAALLVPYLLWLAYAAALNADILLMNPISRG